MFTLKRHVWNVLQPLLNRALDLEPAERLAWLADMRADCPTIVRELELLLRPELDEAAMPGRPVARRRPRSPQSLGLRG
jgi:hypothetical protein